MQVSYQKQVVAVIFFSALPFLAISSTSFAASQYTPKQLEAYGRYVGKTYWVVEHEIKPPAFLSAPAPAAPSFQPAIKDSFEIKEIVGGTAQTREHYYRVVFDSGKEGFLSLGSFLEHFNASLVTVDPGRDAKAKLAKETEAENKRQAWIRAQHWPEHVKEAALKRQPVLGMSTKEAKAALGDPKRMVPMKSATLLLGTQEQWTYENGLVLTFTNGLITRIQTLKAKNE
ncbi:MAG TPA: hypothetical protein VGL70_07845 [Candidatus Binatia bacterium]